MTSMTMKSVCGSAALVAGLAMAASAQQQPPNSTQMVLKGKAPVSKEVLKVKLPRPSTATLANGLEVMVLEDHRTPQVTFQLVIPGAGGYYDAPNQIGLASMVGALMREGTASRTSAQISEELETTGATLNVGAGASSLNATVSGSALTSNFPKLFDLASDVLLHPVFPQAELDRYRTRLKATLIQVRANPDFLASEKLDQLVYGSFPASRNLPAAATLDAATTQSLTDFYKAHFIPDHAIIAFAGDITLAQARAMVQKDLGGWTKANAQKLLPGNPSPITGPKIVLISRPSSVQTTLYVGTQALPRTSPDYTSLLVANRVMGGVMGRLFRHLREEKGYTYGIGSGFSSAPYVSQWTANTSVRTDVTEPALHDLMAEIALMRDTPVPAQELEDSKRALVASFALGLESPQQMLSYYLDSWTYNLPADYWDNYPARISAITAAQAQAAAKKYWDPSRLQIVAVGDVAKVRPILEKLGSVEVFDADGKAIP